MQDLDKNFKFLITGLLIGILVTGIVFTFILFSKNPPDSTNYLDLSSPENPPLTYSAFKEAEIPPGIVVINTRYEKIGEAICLTGNITNNGTQIFSRLQITYLVYNSTGAFLGETTTEINDLDPGKGSEFMVLYPNSEAEIFQLDSIKEE